MKTVAVIIVVLLLAGGIASADINLRDLTQNIEWSAAYATSAGEGMGLSIKVSSVRGFRQYLDGMFTGSKVFGGVSTELPYIKTMLAVDRIGGAVWMENDISAGVVFIRVIK